MSIYIQKIKSIALPNKYTKWYCNIIQNALDRYIIGISYRKQYARLKLLLDYVEGHHILPQCISTDDQKQDIDNYVILTAKEHFVCHSLLRFMFSEKHIKYKMINAVAKFLQGGVKKTRIISSTQYTIARKCASIATIERQTGKKKGPPTQQTRDNISKGLLNSKKFADAMKNKNYIHSDNTKQKLKKAWEENPIRRANYSEKFKETRKLKPEKFKTFGPGSENPQYGNHNAWDHVNLHKEKCKYCPIVTTLGNLARHHNEKCRFKPPQQTSGNLLEFLEPMISD